jgi:hypothetical protein
MTTALWACLGFFLLALVASLVWVAVNALQALRRTRQIPGRMIGQIDELTARVTVLEGRTAGLAGHSELLQRNLAHLNGSLVRLRILLEALQDVRGAVDNVRAFLPSK